MNKICLILILITSFAYGQGVVNTMPIQDELSQNKPVKIGDVVSVAIQTAHPYHSSGQGGIVFEKEFYSKHASYIKIYFNDFDLAPGDYVEITGLNTGESIIYGGQGKIIDKNLTMISDFWSQVLFDDHVRLRLHSTAATHHFGFSIDKVAYGFPQDVIDAILQSKSICGQDDKEPAICYDGTNMYEKGRAVCRLIIGGAGSCTGWLLGCDGHVMTNNHCVGSATEAANTDFIFNYHHTNCNGTGNSVPNTVSASSTFVKTSTGLDYTLLQLPTNPASTYGFLSLSSAAPAVNDRIYIVGHPGGRRKEITALTDLNGDANGNAIVNTITANGIRYMADTEGGSSGSPVLDYNSNLVVAIHNTGGCTNGSSGRSDRLIADIGTDMPGCGVDSAVGIIKVCDTIISTFPYTESFENSLGSWIQDTLDDFDWTILTGATATANTGPSAAVDGAYYAYIEASAPNNPNQSALLSSPCFDITGLSYPQAIFRYHMYGAATGNLDLQVSTNNVTWTTVWSKSGDQGNTWIADTLDLTAYGFSSTLKLRFVGTTAAAEQSDIAIDAFTVQAGTPTCFVVNSFPYTESFENTLGGWTQDSNDDFDWTLQTGATPSPGTGPTAAGDGSHYLFLEASNPNSPSKTAILTSPCFDLTTISSPELIFSYHLFGNDIGDLDLEVSLNGGAWTKIWSKTGSQGNGWVPNIISLIPYTNATDLRLRFKGTTATTWEGDMAIDDLTIQQALNCASTINIFPYTESFENGTGEWMQENADAIDWTIQSGATPSNNTGPTSANEGFQYLYLEASDPNNPSKLAKLRGPCFDLTAVTNPKLVFDYHMFGANMGTLQVQARAGFSFFWSTIWTKTGNQGNAWQTDTIDLSNYTNATNLKLQINGVTGSDFDSDIAIDGLRIVGETATTVQDLGNNVVPYLNIAPNPFNDFISLETNIDNLSSYTITDVQGRIIKQGALKGRLVDLKGMLSGVYFASFSNGQTSVVRKIVKY